MNICTLPGHPRQMVVRAADVRSNDLVQGTYRPGVTTSIALLPGDRWQSPDRHAIALVRPFTATANGSPTLPSGRRLDPKAPVLITRP
ncbi:hypothetical protein [Streptomyces sp. NPDC047070]|uniref:hypothetical protein n=1 Tax=Streptomyces sp. NPDC047070 TaxID=3154923 RepID=UPI0034570F38